MFGGLDILVNNAGADCVTPIIDSKTEEYRRIIDTNLIAPAIFAREAVKSMKKCNACGHIINISSIAGLHLEAIAIPIGMYGPGKYGLRALGIEFRHEINAIKLNVKITLRCGVLTRMMNCSTGKVALVSGSSGGIGLAISKALASHGIKVVGLARRIDKLHEAAAEIGKDKFFPIECDVTNEEDILKVFEWIDEKFGRLDILVNNAGVISSTPILDSKTEEYRRVIDTNLIASAILAREAIKSMKKRNACGHVINISSIAGLHLEAIAIPLGMYGPSKYGLRALGIELRHEINAAKLNVKITNISPGAVMTDMIKDVQDVVSNNFTLKAGDIAEAVIYALGTPETVEIPEITVIPHGTGFIYPQRD